MRQLVEALAQSAPNHRLVEVDYCGDAMDKVGMAFFGGARPPTKDCFGAPFYGYFYGLAAVSTRYVLHMDCDMLFGGGGCGWLREATELLASRSDVLFVCPLAGPPSPTGRIPRQIRRAQLSTQAFGSAPEIEELTPRTYRLRHVSSRVFLADVERLRSVAPLRILDAPPWTFGSNLASTPFLPAETVLSQTMHQGRWLRLDYLGSTPGMWCLHPAQRGPTFAANLPNLIAAIERSAVPGNQEGRFELRDDWLDAVGPERFHREREPATARKALATVAHLTGARAVRNAMLRARWRREHG
jgi:hypothetical protein